MRRRPPGRNSVTASEYPLPCLYVATPSFSAEERTSPGAVGPAAPAVSAAAHLANRGTHVREVHSGSDEPDDAQEAKRPDGAPAVDRQRQQAKGAGHAEDDQPERLRELALGREGVRALA